MSDDNEVDTQDDIKAIVEELRAANKPSAAAVDDDYDQYLMTVEERLGKLFNDNRMFRYASLGLGAAVILLAAGVALSGKAMNGLMAAVNQLGENQQAMGEALNAALNKGDTQTAPVASPVVYTKEADPTNDPEAKVGEPYEGPMTEASERVKAQLEADGNLNGVVKGEEVGPDGAKHFDPSANVE
jgi:hypothetical protein